MDKLVKIYSNEHSAWWRPKYCGYTRNELEAGIFKYEEAKKKYPGIDYDTNKEDYFVDTSITSFNMTTDIFAIPTEYFHDKYINIIFNNNEDEYNKFINKLNGIVEKTFDEFLYKILPVEI